MKGEGEDSGFPFQARDAVSRGIQKMERGLGLYRILPAWGVGKGSAAPQCGAFSHGCSVLA